MLENLLKNLENLGKTNKFNGELDYGAEIPSDDLFEAMRQVGMEEDTKSIINQFLETAPILHQTLLCICFSNFLTSSESPESLKKSRRALRLLLNLTQRSSEFSSKIPSEAVEILESLLATRQFHAEILLLLVKTANFTWLEFQKSSRYVGLLERVVENSEDVEKQMTSVMAYISTLLEKDYGFLANCYAEMTPDGFLAVLEILKCILEAENSENSLKIHQNNLVFVLNLLELIVVDYVAFLTSKIRKEPENEGKRRKATVGILGILVEIVGEMCVKTEMTSHLNEKATVICCVVDVLDSILHAESKFSEFRENLGPEWPEFPPEGTEFQNLRRKIEEERKYQKRAADRPKIPPPSKIARIETSESLNELSEAIFDAHKNVNSGEYEKIGELKLNCLKAIANLASLSPSNKLATVQNGRMALLSVLQCTTRRPEYFMESYAMRNWAIFCVRQLTDECQENKEVIYRLDQPSQPIIDRTKLLKEFGINEDELKNSKRI